MRVRAVAIVLLSGLAMHAAHAERGYYSAPRGGAEHRAGAFYGNGPVYSSPSPRAHTRHRRPSAYPYYRAPYPAYRYPREPRYGAGYSGAEPGPHAGARIDYGPVEPARPYNPKYHGHERRRRELAQQSQHATDEVPSADAPSTRSRDDRPGTYMTPHASGER